MQRRRLRLDDGHRRCRGDAGGRGDLQPDPAGADDHHLPAAAGEVGEQPVGVGERAQVADAVEVGARAPAAAGPRSRWRSSSFA